MHPNFLDSAEAEFAETIAYYNLQSEGLGFEFAVEVKRTIGRIIQYPKAWCTQHLGSSLKTHPPLPNQ